MKKFLGVLAVVMFGIVVAVVAVNVKDRAAETISTGVSEQQPEIVLASQVSPVPQNVNYPDLTVAADRSVHAVVHIMTEYERKNSMYDYFFRDFFGYPDYDRGRAYVGSGSGVIISSDGYIVTNNHVVQDADRIEVTLNDKRTYNAKIVGLDPSSDLAVIKIDEKKLPIIPFGDSDDLKVGEWVLAVGNPFNLTSTVTAGIVSAKARNIHILPDPEGGSALESFIQTDAAVNPGNSGGALVNGKGELIGVNAAIASGTGYYTGYSFAIPASIVKKVTSDLIEFGEVQRAILGVTIREMNSELASEMNIEGLQGVYVAGLSDRGSARAAGIKTGDVILSVDNVEVNSTSQLMEVVGQHNPGDDVDVLVNRNGKNHVYTVTLQSLNRQNELAREAYQAQHGTDDMRLGATLANLNSADIEKLNVEAGVKVKELYNGKLKNAGIKEGFVITHIDNDPVRNVDEFNDIIENKRGGVLIEGVYPGGVRAYYGFGL
ncbi:MAG: deoxyribonuclease HsdR [Marinilabiliales bacterium]|nr:MAG: deoxyribonuclease HsdR [Marinilabiliales bacterium]